MKIRLRKLNTTDRAEHGQIVLTGGTLAIGRDGRPAVLDVSAFLLEYKLSAEYDDWNPVEVDLPRPEEEV